MTSCRSLRAERVLIITDAWDATTDLLVKRLGTTAFRLNTDLIRDYAIEVDEGGFKITNPAGLNISLAEIGSVYWRKPFTDDAYSANGHPDRFFYSECRYLVRELYNLALRHGASSLVEPSAERRFGKLCQLSIARRHFDVPRWRATLGHDFAAPHGTITKSLSGEELDADNVLYTTRVDGLTLDGAYTWLLQDHIDKSADVTVVYVDGETFAFELTAEPGVVDWRQRLHEPGAQHWRHVTLSAALADKIRDFMGDCHLRFGRLDFAKAEDGMWFLEVNPNGQWAWLDLQDEVGLIGAVLRAIQPANIGTAGSECPERCRPTAI